ncbi:MAG TPA: transketolase [Caulobacteraceae bacterium]|jgi:transketolase
MPSETLTHPPEVRANAVSPVAVRRTVLGMLHKAGASHLGSNMSVIEMMVAMFGAVDTSKIASHAPDRSRILISKGHCAAATYGTMAHYGIIPFSLTETYHLDGSRLAGHVSHAVPGVEHSTGALGHGLNVAVGCAMGLRSRGHGDRLVLTLCGDGEIQEGSIWEGLMFASHQKLNNFIALVDNNRISSITNTEKVIDMRPLPNRFAGFGLNVHEVDGHDVGAITAAINEIKAGDRPGVIVCNTIKGKDVPFAEWQPIWHYRSLNDDLYAQALAHLDTLEPRQ